MNTLKKIMEGEMRDVLLTLDVDEYRRFHRKWMNKGYIVHPLPDSDEKVAKLIRQKIILLGEMDSEEYKEAKEWLIGRGLW